MHLMLVAAVHFHKCNERDKWSLWMGRINKNATSVKIWHTVETNAGNTNNNNLYGDYNLY